AQGEDDDLLAGGLAGEDLRDDERLREAGVHLQHVRDAVGIVSRHGGTPPGGRGRRWAGDGRRAGGRRTGRGGRCGRGRCGRRAVGGGGGRAGDGRRAGGRRPARRGRGGRGRCGR